MKSYDVYLLLSVASILDLLQSISHLLWVLWLKLLISQDSPCPRLIMSSVFSNQPFIPPCIQVLLCTICSTFLPITFIRPPGFCHLFQEPSLTSSLSGSFFSVLSQDSTSTHESPCHTVVEPTSYSSDPILDFKCNGARGQGPCPSPSFPYSQCPMPSRCLIKERLYGSRSSSSVCSSSSSKFLKNNYQLSTYGIGQKSILLNLIATTVQLRPL